ncbi:MAG TPA: hypothetical protein VLK84_28400 [Longimicrobium sp.]|nr:hypothetical protein [Longimicrobium sp.]
MKHPFIRPLALAALALAACDSPSGSSRSGPLKVTVYHGDQQQNAVTQPLATQILAAVADEKGKPVANHTVTWTVLTDNGGSPATAKSTTDAAGKAFTTWTLGTRAGAHEMQVSAGSGNGMDTVRATALAGPATSVAVVNNDTLRTLDMGQSAQVALTGADAYGNPVATAGITAQWTSRTPAIATAAGGGTGTVQGVTPGRAVIDVAPPGATPLRVRVTVRGLAQASVTLTADVQGLHGGPGRMLATGFAGAPNGTIHGRGLWERTTGSWQSVAGTQGYEGQAGVLSTGEGWLLGWQGDVYGIYRSPAAGAPWTLVPGPAPLVPSRLTTGGTGVFIARYEGDMSQAAYRRDGNGWTPIPAPAPADSGLSIGHLAAGSATDLLLSGIVRAPDGTQRPYLARWNGTTTTRISLPAGMTLGPRVTVALVAVGSTGTAYAVIDTDGGDVVRRTRLLSITGTTAVEVPTPLEPAGVSIWAMTVGPDGAVYLAGGAHVARYANGAWQSWGLRDYWSVTTPGIHVDAAGRIWVAADQSGRKGTLSLTVFQ